MSWCPCNFCSFEQQAHHMDCSSSHWSVMWGFVFPSSLWEEEKGLAY